jgi:CSLREA domain-containing protein
VLSVSLWLGAPAEAAEIFEVDSTTDGVDADPLDDLCATGSGKCTLRAAIDQANATAGSDIVELPKGTFKLTRSNSGGMVTANEEGDLYVDEPLTIDGRGAGRTVIKQTVNDRVIEAEVASLSALSLTDLKVTGGHVTAPGNQLGGGIRNNGTLTLDRVTVSGNRVTPRSPPGNSFGGGIAQTDGLLIITRSKISGNLVELRDETGSAVGGGISTLAGFLGAEDSRISGNVAKVTGGGTSVGGGLSLRGPSTLTNTAVTGNRAAEGAGLEVSTSSGPGEITLDSSTVSRNRGTRGGGLYLRSAGAHTLLNSTISGNVAPKGGAGIYARLGSADVTHTTVFGNRAKGKRGAVRVDEFVTNMTLVRSIVAGHGKDCRVTSPAVLDAGAQNVFGDPTCTEGGMTTDLVANPRLKDLAKNPGPAPGFVTKTHALKPSSPAIDLITSGCPPPGTDQRGVARPQGEGNCDAGSFEAPG